MMNNRNVLRRVHINKEKMKNIIPCTEVAEESNNTREQKGVHRHGLPCLACSFCTFEFSKISKRNLRMLICAVRTTLRVW